MGKDEVFENPIQEGLLSLGTSTEAPERFSDLVAQSKRNMARSFGRDIDNVRQAIEQLPYSSLSYIQRITSSSSFA